MAHVVSVIGGVDDNCILRQLQPIQFIDQFADIAIDSGHARQILASHCLDPLNVEVRMIGVRQLRIETIERSPVFIAHRQPLRVRSPIMQG